MSSQIVTPNTEAAILARIIQFHERELTPEAARYLLSMKLPSSDEDRVNELSAKAPIRFTKSRFREEPLTSSNGFGHESQFQKPTVRVVTYVEVGVGNCRSGG
jgi:hypothetical protein